MIEDETITPETNPWNVLRDRGELPAVGDLMDVPESDDQPDGPFIHLRITGWCESAIGLVPTTERV